MERLKKMRIIYYIFTFQCGHISIIIQEKNKFVNRLETLLLYNILELTYIGSCSIMKAR